MRLLAHGATQVIPEATEARLQLSEIVLIGAGVPIVEAPPPNRAGDVGREQERKVGKVELSAAPMGAV